jgi:hypothetical protein
LAIGPKNLIAKMKETLEVAENIIWTSGMALIPS